MSTAEMLAARKRQLYEQLDVIMQELRERSRPILDELIALENLSAPTLIVERNKVDPAILEQIRAAD